MYCAQCKCEYTGWKYRCPVCKYDLVDSKLVISETDKKTLDYATLVETIRENGGSLTIKVTATDIQTKRWRGFPYIGRGYAWSRQFVGEGSLLSTHLTTTQVGRDRSWTFPYFGFGFAWEKEIQGNVNGNPLTLKAEKVGRETKMRFPYRGYGRAWVQQMSGACGDHLKVKLTITEVRRRNNAGFPYFGFGFAWANAGDLTLTLVE